MSKIPNNIAALSDEELDRVCGMLHSTYASWVRVVARNPGIKTHLLPSLLKPSNNPAAISRMLNRKLLRFGLQIEKHILTKPSQSWGWYLVEIHSGVDKAA